MMVIGVNLAAAWSDPPMDSEIHGLATCAWSLRDKDGVRSYDLPHTMVFVGRQECDVNINVSMLSFHP